MLTPEICARLNAAEAAPVIELETPNGPAVFVKYKPGNFKGQDVLVRFGTGKTHWFKLNKIEVTNTEAVNKFLNNK